MSFSTERKSIDTIGMIKATKIKINKGATSIRARRFWSRSARPKLFLSGIPSADSI
jgi:hypothetical protein